MHMPLNEYLNDKLHNSIQLKRLNITIYAAHRIFLRTWRLALCDPPRSSGRNRRERRCRAVRYRNRNPPGHWSRPRTASGRRSADSSGLLWDRVGAAEVCWKVEGQYQSRSRWQATIYTYPLSFFSIALQYLYSSNFVSGGRPGMNVITARNRPM